MPKTHVNGLEMYYEVQGSGPPVVLIGGLSQDHLGWAFQAPALAAAGYQVISFDNRDAGQTAQSPGPYGIPQFVDDTIGLMNALGLGPAHLVGASMGGMVAQELALAHPARVASLTLVCTAAVTDPELAGVLRAWRDARPHCAADDFVLSLSPWLLTYRFLQQQDALRGFLQMVRDNPFPQSVAGFQRQCDAVLSHDAAARVGGIRAPAHVIVGSEDALTPPRHSRDLAGRLPGAKLTEVPETSHLLFLEKPEVFNSILLGALAAV